MICDPDTDHGGVMNVMRVARDFKVIGAAIHIEVVLVQILIFDPSPNRS